MAITLNKSLKTFKKDLKKIEKEYTMQIAKAHLKFIRSLKAIKKKSKNTPYLKKSR